jgi:peptidoglycan/xylan/chitin deacetylase (PgdA/CDA1 family)
MIIRAALAAPVLRVAQCWDDGVSTDARLTDLLRRHGARAAFNLNAGLVQPRRSLGWLHQGVEVWRLGWDDMRAVYEGFTVANHGLTHQALPGLPEAALRQEVADNRSRLQQFFGQQVDGYVYAFGQHDALAERVVAETGHRYARTTALPQDGWPHAQPHALAPTCHVHALDFWRRFEAARHSGCFYFWGHSYELLTETHWQALDAALARIGQTAGVRWCTPAELLDAP